ncbi:MAG: N-acetyl-alpha-D-glucosaminyl L-malate synthase BshA [Acidobacteria bacterium]|nr:MAG: N-acetyl-alpha-D-glucosaminyl L-malate synthase BshA [Acidobacteriota bacterium]
MKIGITCYPTYGGSGVVATEMGKELAALGHEIHFISYSIPIKLNSTSELIHFHEVEMLNYPLFEHPPYALALATKMAEVATHQNLDLLHVHYAIPHSVSAYLAKQMLLPRRLPVITTLHGTDITLVGNDRSYLPITKFSIERSDGVTAVSVYLRDLTYREFEIRRPIEMIPNFVNCDVFRRSTNRELKTKYAPNGEKILVHVSNFRPVKRVTDVIEIFDRVRQKTTARLLMIGDGPERSSAEWLAKSKRLGCQVVFLGKQESIAEILSIADLMLLPSETESFGLVALEAMACEVPVVASNVGGLPEVIRDGQDGFLVKPHEVDTMALKAAALLADDRKHQAMGQSARQRALENFCSSKIIAQYEQYYEQVIRNGGFNNPDKH